MKINRSGIGYPVVLLQAVVEILLLFPLIYIPAYYLLSAESLWGWPALILAGYVLGYSGTRVWKLSRLASAGLWACITASVLAIAMTGIGPALLFTWPMMFAAGYRGIRMAHNGWDALFPGPYYLAGLLMHGGSSFVLSFQESVHDLRTMLAWTGALALIATLLVLNQRMVLEQTLPGKGAPVLERRVLRHNRALIVILLLITAAVVVLPRLQQFVGDMIRRFAAWIAQWFQSTPSEVPPPEPEVIPPTPELPFGDETPSPSPWLALLEQIVIYLVYALLIAALVFALYRLGKHLPRLLRKLSAWMNRRFSHREGQEMLGYEDEIEQIEHEPAGRKLLQGLRRRFAVQRDEPAADNAAAVRQTYRRILSRKIREGYHWNAALTPRETGRDLDHWKGTGGEAESELPPELIELYEVARYGGRAPSDEEVQRVLKASKRHKE